MTDLQRAMVEHDDDMARLDRNTLRCEAPADAARKAAEEIWQSQCCVHTAHPPLGKKRLEGIISRHLPVPVGDETQKAVPPTHRRDCGMPDCFICYGDKRYSG